MSRIKSRTAPLTDGETARLSRRLLHEAEAALDAALGRYCRGQISAAALTTRAQALQAAVKRAREISGLWGELERKYSPDQPRDGHGRWTDGVGASGGAVSASSPAQRGWLSMVYESSFRPGHEAAAAGKVSDGTADAGGVSYGAFQLSSQKGQVQAFLKSAGSPWAVAFEGLDPTEADGAFGETWKTVAADDPAAFLAAQERYIQTTHYNPVVRQVLKATGLDIDSRPLAVQQVVWSIAVQHGGAVKIIRDAVNDLDDWTSPSEPGYDAALINNLYDFRSQYVVQHNVKSAVSLVSRYSDERKMALSLLGAEK